MSTSQITQPLQPRFSLARAGRWAPLPVILTGTFIMVLDFFIVNVALPSIQSGLHASSSAIEWIVAGYGLTSAVFLVTGGRLGDRLGRRRTFSIGLGLFTLSSAVCGIAPDATVLVIARLMQGVGGALLMPNVMAIISVTYSGEDRVKALSAYGMVMGLAAVGGQLIGGVLVQAEPVWPRLAHVLSHQRPGRARRPRARPPRSAGVTRRARDEARPHRNRLAHRRA